MSHRSAVIVTLVAAMGPFFCARGAAQETDFRGWEDRPGLHFYLVQGTPLWSAGALSVTRSVVRDHVRGDHALRLTFHATPGDAGLVVYRPPGFVVANRTAYAALSFWVKGDGSDGVGVIGIGDGGETDPRAEFLLGSREWQPVRLRWGDLGRDIAETRIRSIFFGVTPETKRPATYVADRIEVVGSIEPPEDDGEVRAAGRKAAELADVPQPTDLSAFVTHREKLASCRALLEAAKRPCILVIGDAVAQGAGLWNVPRGAREQYLFWGVLEREVRRKGRETTVVPVFVEGPEEAAGRIDGVLERTKPALVVFQVSSSAPGAAALGARSRARRAVQYVFAACRRRGVQVLALPMPPLPGPLRRVDHAAILLEEAERAGLPAADFRALAAARGKGFEGEYYATSDQLNVQGHLLAATLLTSCLTEP